MKYLLLSSALLLGGCMATIDPMEEASYSERPIYIAKAHVPIRIAPHAVNRGHNHRAPIPYWAPHYSCQWGSTYCSHTNYRRKLKRPFYITYRKAPVFIGKKRQRYGPSLKKAPKKRRSSPNSRKNHKKKNKHKRHKRR